MLLDFILKKYQEQHSTLLLVRHALNIPVTGYGSITQEPDIATEQPCFVPQDGETVAQSIRRSTTIPPS